MFDETFEAAVQLVLAGDESVAAANDLERVVLDDYPGDERLEDLHEALAPYSPGQRRTSTLRAFASRSRCPQAYGRPDDLNVAAEYI